MYISNQQYKIAGLTHDRVEQSAALLAVSFTKYNEAWIAVNISLQEAYDFIVAKLHQTIQWQDQLREDGTIEPDTFMSLIYLDNNNKIYGVWVSVQLCQYLSRKSKVILPKFEILQTYGHELEKSIPLEDIVPGKCAYGIWGATAPEFMGSGYTALFWLDGAHYMHTKGITCQYSRPTNVKALNLFTRTGAIETTSKITAVQNGNTVDLWHIRWPFGPIQKYHNMVHKLLNRQPSL